MKINSIIDYLSCILVRLIGPVIRILPEGLTFFLGKRLGDLFYYFDFKHKAITYANLKTAFGDRLSPPQLSSLAKEFYQTFGQNLLEIFLLPLVDKEYINKYISFEGLENIPQGFKGNKGVILLTVHEGSWELSSIICPQLGFPFVLFVRQQRYPRLNQLLNSYRRQRGCKIIQRQNQARQLSEALKNNQAIGITADQGGRSGVLVKFFGKDASFASGAVRLALRYSCAIIPVFSTRIKGPYSKIIIEPPFEIRKSQNRKDDIQDNLQRLAQIFQGHIRRYPKEYLWSYKIWKYTDEKKILILSDGITGHLRQSQALADIISDYFREKGIKSEVDSVEVKFNNRFALLFSSCLAGKYTCQGCLWCLGKFLRKDIYQSLISNKADIIISCGSSIASVNYILSSESLAKSIVIMRPSILSTSRFHLVIMPRHDRPPKRKNVVVTEGALNLIDEEYLQDCISHIAYRISQNGDRRLAITDKQLTIGLLIGGDTRSFSLSGKIISAVIRQIKAVSERLDADILVTTSRRTSGAIEEIVKEEFSDYERCKLLIIANEKNLPEAVGGILGISEIVISTPESISMISEAVNSKKYVLVFKAQGLDKKHRRFLDYFAKNKYIYLVEPFNLSKEIENIWLNKPPIYILRDNLLVSDAIKRIL
jgi:KDO2-lipid IV(A) lauroyltransferase